MKEKPRDINIEALTTPKGDVPTVKGLENAINSVISEYHEEVRMFFNLFNNNTEPGIS